MPPRHLLTWLLAGVCMVGAPGALRAGESPEAAARAKAADVQALEKRVESLENEVRALKQQVQALVATQKPTKEHWVDRLKGLRDHMQTAFQVGPQLVVLDPDEGLQIVREAWPQITVAEVKTGLLKAFQFGKALRPKKHPRVLQILHLGMTDADPEVQKYAAAYVREYALEDFSHDAQRRSPGYPRYGEKAPEEVVRAQEYAQWYRQYGEEPPEDVARLNQARVPEGLKRQLAEIQEAFTKGEMQALWGPAAKLGETPHPYAIPTLIGIIDADNSYDTVYGVGYFGLGRITGVEYSPYHDGAWWRRWWEENKDRYPEEVRNIPIPDLPKTAHGKTYTPLPEDFDTLDGKLRHLPRLLAAGATETRLEDLAQAIAEHRDPSAIPVLIGVIAADDTEATIRVIGRSGLHTLTGVSHDDAHDGAWWRRWWEENRAKYPAEVQKIAIPDFSGQAEAWKKARKEAAWREALSDVADVPAEECHAGDHEKMRYFLIGPRQGAEAPEDGYKLVVVMPGGSGDEAFHPFVRRLFKHSMTDEFLVAQPIAFKWRPEQQVVWPTSVHPVDGQEFSTEEFVEAVIRDVGARQPIDPRYVFTLTWSSSGPAAYAIALQEETAVTGSYILMSVYRPEWHPPVARAKGRLFAIEHSPDDQLCPFSQAQQAQRELTEAGAIVRFTTYQGGHGWHGDLYPRTAEGLAWLVEQAGAAAARAEKEKVE